MSDNGAELWAEFLASVERGEGRYRQKEPESATIDPDSSSFHFPSATSPEESGAKRGLRYAGRVLVAIFALIGVLTVAVGSVKAIREPVLQYLVEHFGECSSVTFPESENIVPYADGIGMEVDPLAGLLPEGYFLSQTIQLGDYGTRWIYSDGSVGYISYHVQPEAGFIDFDNEETNIYSELQINGHEAIAVQSDHLYIVWFDDASGLLHELESATLDYAQLFEIATTLSHPN